LLTTSHGLAGSVNECCWASPAAGDVGVGAAVGAGAATVPGSVAAALVSGPADDGGAACEAEAEVTDGEADDGGRVPPSGVQAANAVSPMPAASSLATARRLGAAETGTD
jgi:hypothetical protein